MIPSRSATSALHMYAPMLVVEVCTLRVPSASRRSAGSPERSSVIATNEAHVAVAYACNCSLAPAADPADTRAGVSMTSSTASTATLATPGRTAAALRRMGPPPPRHPPNEALQGSRVPPLAGAET